MWGGAGQGISDANTPQGFTPSHGCRPRVPWWVSPCADASPKQGGCWVRVLPSPGFLASRPGGAGEEWVQVGERKCRLGPGDVGLLWGGVRQQRPQALGG